MARPLPGAPGSSYGRGGGRGAKVVNRPLTKAEKKQNTAAETYKTKGTPSPAQAKARAASSERMKGVQSKARNFEKAVTGAAAGGAGVGVALGRGLGKSEGKKIRKPAHSASVRAKAEAKKKKK